MTASPPVVILDTVLVHADDVLCQEIGGEAVLLDLASEQYFGLDAVGTRIWMLIDGEAPLARIHEVLSAEYDAPPEQIGQDLLALVQSMLDAGLVRPR